MKQSAYFFKAFTKGLPLTFAGPKGTCPRFFRNILLLFMMLFGSMALLPESSTAQEVPVREYVPQEGIVALSADLSMRDALSILNTYANNLENKRIFNESDYEGPIQLAIPGLYWLDALEMIAARHGLRITEFNDRFELDSQQRGAARQSRSEEAGTDDENAIYSNTREIEISATFFQGDRRFLREIGINWSAVRDGTVEIDYVGGNNVPEPPISINTNISEIIGTGTWQIDALLNTLEANNKGEIISSPRVVVMDGETGRIQIGQDFSIKQRDFAGNVIDQFFSTGTILTVTPELIRDGEDEFIYMEVNAERSSAQPDAVSTIINKQQASTRILMLDGETTAIAGLYETDESSIRRGVPILKDLPGWFFGLKYLFSYESNQVSQTELVIILKAELIPSLQERVIQQGNRMDRIRREIEAQRLIPETN